MPRRGVPGPRKRETMNGDEWLSEAEKARCFRYGKVGDMFVKAEIWMFFLTLRCIFDACSCFCFLKSLFLRFDGENMRNALREDSVLSRPLFHSKSQAALRQVAIKETREDLVLSENNTLQIPPGIKHGGFDGKSNL